MIKPEDIINKYTVEELCQSADEYYSSLSDPTHQMAKPFSSLVEAPEMLQNMGLLLSGLKLAKTMTILEFASGACWFSRYLQQLQCITISCDVSIAALQMGESLFRKFPIIGNKISEPQFLHFNGHKINLPDNSVERIICNDGFHHIPNQEEVIAEFARILKKGGIAGFSEPGRYHSHSPQSQYEMKNYKVLENDILLTEIFSLAKKHGFTDIRIKILGDLEISLATYKLLTNSVLLKLLNIVSPGVYSNLISKTIFFLYKGKLVNDSRSHIGLAHTISLNCTNFTVHAGSILNIPVIISNTGSSRWLNANIHDIGVVRIGTHLYNNSNKLLELDFSRNDIPSPIEPGEKFEQLICLKFNEPGMYQLAIDLVSEKICWFENLGSIPRYITVNVE